MFSYEERIRAVKLYIKLGKRLNATIRQLGYPTKNSLIGWYREYEQTRDFQVGYGGPSENGIQSTLAVAVQRSHCSLQVDDVSQHDACCHLPITLNAATD